MGVGRHLPAPGPRPRPPGVKPLPRYNHIQIFDSLKATTLVFGGTVPTDTTYGPQEIWEYLANSSPRPNGVGLLGGERRRAARPATASTASAARCPPRSARAPAWPATSPGNARHLQRRAGRPARRHLPERSGLRRQPAVQEAARAALRRVQRVRERPLRGRRLLQHRLQRHLQDLQPGRRSRGTCSFVPAGNEDPVGAPACVSIGDPGRGRATAPAPARTARRPNGKPCTAGGQCTSGFCIDGVCCNSQLRPDLLPVRPGRGSSGAAAAILSGRHRSQRDHALRRRRCQYCNGSGTCATNKKPNGADLHRAPPTAAATTASTASAATAPAPAPASRARCRARSARASTCRPARRTRTRRRPAAAPRTATPRAPARRAASRTALKCTAASECGSGFCVDGVCCVNACTGACSTCNGDSARNLRARADRLRAIPPVRRAQLLRRPAQVHDGQEAERRGLRAATSSAAPTTASTAPAARASAPATAGPAPTRRAPARSRRDGTDPRNELQGRGAASAAGRATAPGACRWRRSGHVVPDGGLPDATASSRAAGTCDGAGNCAGGRRRTDCNGLRLLHRHGDRRRSARPTARPIPSARSSATASVARRRHRRRAARRRRCPAQLRPRPRLPAQHAVPGSGTLQRRRLLRQRTATSAAPATRRARRDLHPDPGGHRSRDGVHEQRERSDGQVRRASATATRRASIRRPGPTLRPVQGLRRRPASATRCPARTIPPAARSTAAGSNTSTCRDYSDLTTQPLRLGRRLQGEEHGQGLHGLHRHLHAGRRRGAATRRRQRQRGQRRRRQHRHGRQHGDRDRRHDGDRRRRRARAAAGAAAAAARSAAASRRPPRAGSALLVARRGVMHRADAGGG